MNGFKCEFSVLEKVSAFHLTTATNYRLNNIQYIPTRLLRFALKSGNCMYIYPGHFLVKTTSFSLVGSSGSKSRIKTHYRLYVIVTGIAFPA